MRSVSAKRWGNPCARALVLDARFSAQEFWRQDSGFCSEPWCAPVNLRDEVTRGRCGLEGFDKRPDDVSLCSGRAISPPSAPQPATALDCDRRLSRLVGTARDGRIFGGPPRNNNSGHRRIWFAAVMNQGGLVGCLPFGFDGVDREFFTI